MLTDTKLDIKIKLAGIWTSVMFLYLYADYFGLYVPGALQRMLAGNMAPFGPVTQAVLIGSGAIMVIPSIMIALTLLSPAALGRWLNAVFGALYTVIMMLTLPGSWWYYMMYGTIEIVLTVLVVSLAWRWPKRTHP